MAASTAAAAEQQLQNQLVELERQITDEFDARAAIGDKLTRLEADNARLRSQVRVPSFFRQLCSLSSVSLSLPSSLFSERL